MAHGAGDGVHNEASLNLENTCIAMIPAAGAMPEIVVPPVLHWPPAAMPATWVPWSHPRTVLKQFTPEPGAVEEVTPPGQSDDAIELLVE